MNRIAGGIGAAAAALALSASADAAVLSLAVPQRGRVSVAQVIVHARHKPRLRIRKAPGAGSGVATVVGAKAKHSSHGTFVVRLVIVNRGTGAKAASAHAAQDFGFARAQVSIPGVGNRGVTGASSFLNISPTGGPATLPKAGSFCATDLAVGDFNADGVADISAVSGGLGPGDLLELGDQDVCHRGSPLATGLNAALFGPAGPLPPERIVAGTGGGVAVAAGGGNIDELVGSGSGAFTKLTVLLGLADGTFGFPRRFTLRATNPVSVAAADIDLDGLSDLAIAESGVAVGPAGNAVEIFSGSFLTTGPATAVAPSSTIPLPATGHAPLLSVALGRLDGDSFADIAVLAAGGGLAPTLTTIHSLGSGLGFGPPVTVPLPRGIAIAPNTLRTAIAVADATHDIFIATSNGIQVLENPSANGNAGDYVPGPVIPPVAGLVPNGVVVGDITGDNIPDVIGLNRASGTVTVWPGAGLGGTASGPPFVNFVGANPLSLAVGNFSGGREDLAVIDSGPFGSGAAPGSISLVAGGATQQPGCTQAPAAGLSAYSDSFGSYEKQVTGLCPNPAALGLYDVLVEDLTPGEGIYGFAAHSPADCAITGGKLPSDSLACQVKPDGRICIHLHVGPGAPAANETVRVTLRRRDGSTISSQTLPVARGAAPPCPVASG